MSLFLKIAANLFADVAYVTLSVCGWKRKTVKANLTHVSQGTSKLQGCTTSLNNIKENPHNEIPESGKLYRQMLKKMTHHVGELLFCFDTYKNLPEDTMHYPCKKNGCSFELAEGAAAVIKKMRKGGIFLTAHYGNYEASGAWLCALGVPLKASFIPLKPAWLNRIVYEKIRCVKGRPYSIDAKTPREFLAQLDGTANDCRGQKQLFCLLADQDSRISSALDGTFLGQPAKINPLPDFLLRHRPDTPVFFCWIEEIDRRRETRDEYRGLSSGQSSRRKILHAVEATTYTMEPAAEQQCKATSGRHVSILDGAYRHWLEERIAECPELWYGWTHRRFKSKNPEIYR